MIPPDGPIGMSNQKITRELEARFYTLLAIEYRDGRLPPDLAVEFNQIQAVRQADENPPADVLHLRREKRAAMQGHLPKTSGFGWVRVTDRKDNT